MADKQDFYFGQIINEGDMDNIYADLDNAEQNLASEGSLSQGAAAEAARLGGILAGLVVTYNDPTTVNISAGIARDSSGRRINLPVTATVNLTNLGDTPEGDTSAATGDGTVTASSIGNEAWLSLYIAYDVNLSDTRTDALDNLINFRQTESFHFELLLGADSIAPASARATLNDNRVLLADILLNNSGQIRQPTTYYAICGSSQDFNRIGYGLDDTANMAGRRSDWIAIDPDGSGDYTLLQDALDTSEPNSKAYYNIRAGSSREAMEELIQLYVTPGSATKAGGSEIIGGRPVTGKALSSPGAAVALDMPSGSVHTQLEALYDKVNTLMSRGSDTLTGNMTISGTLNITSTLDVTGLTTLDDVDVTGQLTIKDTGNLQIGDTPWLQSTNADSTLDIIDGGLTIQADSTVGGTNPRNFNVKPDTYVPATDIPVTPQMRLWNAYGKKIRTWNMWGTHQDCSRYYQDFMVSAAPPDIAYEGTSGGGNTTYGADPFHGGIMEVTTDVNAGDYRKVVGPNAFVFFNTESSSYKILHMRARVRMTTTVADNELFVGLQESLSLGDPRLTVTGGAMIVLASYGLAGSFNWRVSSFYNGLANEVDTGITRAAATALDAGWVEVYFRADLENDEIQYWVSGSPAALTSTGTITFKDQTNAAWRDGAFSPFILCGNRASGAGGANSCQIDLWEVWDETQKG